MTDQNAPRPDEEQPEGSSPFPGRFIEQATHEQPIEEDPENAQAGAGPFTLREWFVLGAGAVLLILSFFSVVRVSGVFGPMSYLPVWSLGLDWIGAVGVPVAAAVLVAVRRVNPSLRNVGALSIDQFASVAFCLAAYVWLTMVWNYVSYASVVAWLGLVVALVGVFFTVVARFVPPFSDDFSGRDEVPAHPVARPARPIARVRTAPAPAWDAQAQPAPSPSAGQPAAFGSVPTPWDPQGAASAPTADPQPTSAEDAAGESPAAEQAPVAAEQAPVAAEQAPVAPQPFWALVPEERQVYDEHGQPGFLIGPTAWALVLEDRGDVFVMRHDDGRIGFLFDISGVTRG